MGEARLRANGVPVIGRTQYVEITLVMEQRGHDMLRELWAAVNRDRHEHRDTPTTFSDFLLHMIQLGYQGVMQQTDTPEPPAEETA